MKVKAAVWAEGTNAALRYILRGRSVALDCSYMCPQNSSDIVPRAFGLIRANFTLFRRPRLTPRAKRDVLCFFSSNVEALHFMSLTGLPEPVLQEP